MRSMKAVVVLVVVGGALFGSYNLAAAKQSGAASTQQQIQSARVTLTFNDLNAARTDLLEIWTLPAGAEIVSAFAVGRNLAGDPFRAWVGVEQDLDTGGNPADFISMDFAGTEESSTLLFRFDRTMSGDTMLLFTPLDSAHPVELRLAESTNLTAGTLEVVIRYFENT